MAMRKSFLNLGLGVVGGCLAFVAIDAIRGKVLHRFHNWKLHLQRRFVLFHLRLTRLFLLGERVAWI